MVQRSRNFRNTSRMASQTRSGPRHTTNEQAFEVIVRYPHHPFAGQRVTVNRRITHAGQVHYSIQAPDQHPVLLPAWMTESPAAALPIVEVPRLPLDPLRALHGLIEAQRSPSSSGMIRIDGGDNGTASTMATTRSPDACGSEPASATRYSGSRRDRQSSQASHRRVRRLHSKREGGEQ